MMKVRLEYLASEEVFTSLKSERAGTANAVQKTRVSWLSQRYLFSPSPFVRRLIVSRPYHMEERDTVSADRCFMGIVLFRNTCIKRETNTKAHKTIA